MDVKDKTGKTLSILLDKKTKVNVDKKKATTAELKVGQSVVVDAFGDDEFDLLALDVRIGFCTLARSTWSQASIT